MNGRELSFLLVCAALSLGCSKKDEADAKADAKTDAKADAKIDAKADAKADAKTDAETDLANAAGGAVVDPDAVTDCPQSLSGREKVSRVITKACGVVPVTADYSIDGATLTLEAGATLAFADGAALTVGYYEPAKLIVKGTAEAPVTLTSSGDKAAGVWQGVRLHAKANRSSIQGLVLEHAGSDDEAALVVQAQDVTIAGTTVRMAKGVGIDVDNDGMATISGTTLADVGPMAIRVTPAAAGGVSADNTYPAGALVQVQGGRLTKSAQWAALGTPWMIGGTVQINGDSGQRAALTLAPGAELRFGGEAELQVGYYNEAALIAEGTAAKPIRFTAHEREEAGAWSGLKIYGKAEARFAHASFSYGGKQEDEGALLIDGPARVSVKDTTFGDDAVGVVVRGNDAKLQAFDTVTFERTPVALRAAARYLGALGSANTYTGEPRIIAEADKLDANATWKLQSGAKVELDGVLQVSGGRLTLEAGITLHVKDGVEVQVGYYDNAGLELRGTAELPITFLGQRDEAGAWGGLVFFGKAKGNVLEHVVVRNAGEQAGVRFDGESDAKIDGLRCDVCSTPALMWTCKSKVEHKAVEAGEGTPSALAEPSCK